MAKPHEKLADSLNALRQLQGGGRRVFRSDELTRIHRERLLRHGFVQQAMRGWLISSSPSTQSGESTPWYASFWEFCARYCEDRFGDQWHLSPEQSLLLHAENTVIPAQVVIYTPAGTNNKIDLLFGTSLYDLKEPEMPPAADLMVRDGLRTFVPDAALVRVPENFFVRQPIETRVMLGSLRDASELLRRLLDGGHSVVAGRLAGALRRIERPALAEEIVSTMKAADYVVRETDPFASQQLLGSLNPAAPPIAGRLEAMWQSMRGRVLEIFPQAPGAPQDRSDYLHAIDDIYRSDAYHSLSIEGYTVTPDLVDRVRAGNWDPDNHGADRQSRDALAARGYWQAFQVVKGNIAEILAGAGAANLLRTSHREWYRELFQPCVAAGLIAPGALAGYRNDAVYLRTSRYVPPRWEAVRDAMPALFDLLEREPDAGVRAVLGHWMFGYIHPYPDGNGRIARFLMNAMLASGGYPWTVIRVEDRTAYLSALDAASLSQDIVPFAQFIAGCVRG
jgi:fido (protein-threonine AMPylation protein)